MLKLLNLHFLFPSLSSQLRELEIANHSQTLTLTAPRGKTKTKYTTHQVLHPLDAQRLLASCSVPDPVAHSGALLLDALQGNPGNGGQTLLTAMKRSMPLVGVDTVLALANPLGMSTIYPESLQLQRFASALLGVHVIKLDDVVTSLQEGPAPSWISIKRQSYLQQRRQLVYESLEKPCGRLLVMFERALRLPTWQIVQ